MKQLCSSTQAEEPMSHSNHLEITATAAFAARQAILTPDGTVLGYELLWRRNLGDTESSVIDNYDATVRALSAVALNIGWTRFFEGALAFVNVDIDFVEKRLFFAMPARTTVLEIAAVDELNARQRHALAEARHHGYAIAWDNVHHPADPRLEFARPADYVKINFRQTTFEAAVSIVETCLARHIKPILYEIEDEAEQAFFEAKGVSAIQGNYLQRSEMRVNTALPRPPVALLHEFRRILALGRPVADCVAFVEHCPELFLALLMLTDVAWQEHWPYPNTIEQLLRGLSRATLAAWLDLMVHQLYREPAQRRNSWAISFLQPAIFARLILRQVDSYEPQIQDEAYMMGFVSQVLSTYPDLVDGNDAPIHLGRALSPIVGAERSPLLRVFNYVSGVSRAKSQGDFSEVILPPAVAALLAESQTCAIEAATTAITAVAATCDVLADSA